MVTRVNSPKKTVLIVDHYLFPCQKFRTELLNNLQVSADVLLLLYLDDIQLGDSCIKKVRTFRSDVHPLNTGMFGFIRSQIEVLQVIRKQRAEYVLVYGIKQAIFRSFSGLFAKRSVCLIAGFGRKVKSPSVVQRLAYRSLAVYNHIICLNRHDADILRRLGCSQITILPSEGVNCDLYRVKSYIPRNKQICFIGRVIKSKGIDRMLDVFSRTDKFDVVVNIYGPLDITNTSEEYISKVQLLNCKNIRYLGEIQNSAKVLSEHKYLFFPSTYGEGLPLIILEAMLAKCIPVVVSNPTLIDLVVDFDLVVIPQNWSVDDLTIAIQKYEMMSMDEIGKMLEARAEKVELKHNKKSINRSIAECLLAVD